MPSAPTNRPTTPVDLYTSRRTARRHPWTFLTQHGHVLLVVATDPHPLVENIAATVGISPRKTLQILKDLEDTGYLYRMREGRRTRYTIDPHKHFRHPATSHKEIGALLAIFTQSPADTRY